VSFSLTPKQAEAQRIVAGPETHNLIYGGSRSGKTFLFCRGVGIRALKAPGSRHAIIRFRAADARQAVWADTWSKMMSVCFPGVRRSPNKQDGFEELENGSQIWFGGLDDAERADKILGKEYATIYLNEVSQISYQSVLTARTRLAQNVAQADGHPLKLKAYYDLNPVGAVHWTFKEFEEGVNPVDGEPLPAGDRTVFRINPYDNRGNLPDGYLAQLEAMPAAQRKRFLAGEYSRSYDGAIWRENSITRIAAKAIPVMRRIVVAVDPSGASEKGDKRSDDIGIIVAGLGLDGNAYVLEDLTLNGGPERWASVAVEAYHRHRADSIVAERNFGGDMVRAVIQAQDKRAPVRLVTASRGKVLRAEPVAALYAGGEVFHAGRFPDLEDQMFAMTRAGYMGDRSPDRVDALVWALTDLMLAGAQGERVKVGFG